MVIAAARQIREGDVVNVGMRLPLLAYALAKMTHARTAMGFFDSGIVRAEPLTHEIVTMCDAANVRGSQWCTDMIDLMNLMQQGFVDVGFLGGAEVDQFGNVNTSYIGDPQKPRVRLPGSGGAADIAQFSGRTVIIMAHEKHRLVREVQYVTTLGYGRDGHERERLGMSGGPSALVTTLGVFTFDNPWHTAQLAHIHPGATLEDIKSATGWDIIMGDAPPTETPWPTTEEVAVLELLDGSGFWTGKR